ncbi:methyltransferase domain-containing protein [Bacillus luteolus]|uniref:Methyltransferase domain-containing protein n=1 Tax=Litchfieldia luteola TaxID=682179 RepID=A0ABR9QNB9_9BACI|nr:class I SAM-dependent methyltransferase [Cytobacillus luteolus]MBE4909939.1 methyltransferase domain-containing protein [Cytobacillus luteolus]MBP1942505.1 cyclopropane fatty-acyl-phospholipid synthase-like methyltransferase [Cytobacillus luteolus]
MEKKILNYEDLLVMLDDFLREPKEFWDTFYEDRSKDIPFFKVKGPDENLVEYFSKGLAPKKVLEIGSGPGRNAIYMAQKGCTVTALDISEKAIKWARERASKVEVEIDFQCASLFDFEFEPHSYDFVYDCGMFHHIAPHRRLTYVEILKKALKNGGLFGIVCFNTEGALATSDWDIYNERSLKGGIGYTEERLKEIFNEDFNIIDFRRMNKMLQSDELFGEDFLWTSLMQIKN